MDTGMGIGRALVMFSGVSFIWAGKCDHYSLTTTYKGGYCTGEGILTQLVDPHLCRYQCIVSTTCNAYNYNTTRETCTYFSSPCPQPFSDPTMEFAVFTQRPYEQCYEWIAFISGDPIDERMARTEHVSHGIIGRTQRSGQDIVCSFRTRYSKCYGYFGAWYDTSRFQRLRIMEGCATYWVTYTSQDPLPPRAVIAGHMANGDIVFVSKFVGNVVEHMGLPAHYSAGAEYAVTEYGRAEWRSNTMMIMVVL